MNKAEKQAVVKTLNTAFKSNSSVLLIDFTGLNVLDETELRQKVRETGRYTVVKNTLALRAAKDTAVAQLSDYFVGPTAVAYSEDDPIGLAKTLTDFLKTHAGMSFKAGVLDEKVLSAEDVRSLAEMPSREELLSKLVYMVQAPLRQFAAAIQSPLRNLASVLTQLQKEKE